jgi:hypothetical protein
VNFFNKRDYQRAYLRAPFKEEILYTEGDYFYKTKAINISEGGILLENVPYYPKDCDLLDFIVKLPYHPFFKSFTYNKLKTYSEDLFKPKVIAFKGKIVRKSKQHDPVKDVFMQNIGLQIINIDAKDRSFISEYVSHFSSNLIFLQSLIDNLNNEPTNIEHCRLLAKILGYNHYEKVILMSKKIKHDYINLQWL